MPTLFKETYIGKMFNQMLKNRANSWATDRGCELMSPIGLILSFKFSSYLYGKVQEISQAAAANES